MMEVGFGRTIEQMKAYENRIVNMRFNVITEVLINASSEIINETHEDVSEIEDEISSTVQKYKSYYKARMRNLNNNGGLTYKSTDIEYAD